MKILTLTQGSPAWHAHRATARNASDAPAMMGDSDHTTRDALLRRMASGVAPDVSPWQQRIFDNGHAVEPALRAYAERVIGDDLSPIVATSDDSYLSCSFDGVTFDEETNAEFKQSNAGKIADIEQGILPKTDKWQVVQGFAVNENAQQCIYVCGDGTEEGTRHLIVERATYADDINKRLRAGWALIDEDRKTYVVEPKQAPVVATPQESLPAVSVRLDGSLAVISNLDLFGAALREFIDRIPEKPATDQQFADCEAACKTLKKAEEALAAAENNALAQIDDVEAMHRTVADFNKLARDVRLRTERLVKAEKENRKAELIAHHVENLRQYVLHLNQEFGAYALPWQSDWPRIFGQDIKGMSSLASMNSKLNARVAEQKIEFNEDAAHLRANISQMTAVEATYLHLFPDRVQLCQSKTHGDLRNLIAIRIAQAKDAETKRVDAERERIRQEEEAKARAAVARAQDTQESVDPQTVAQARGGELFDAPTPASFAGLKSREVVVAQNPASLSETPTLTLGAINARLAPLRIDGAGIAHFDIEPIAIDKRAKLYSEAQFGNLLNELSDHLDRIAFKAARGSLTETEAA